MEVGLRRSVAPVLVLVLLLAACGPRLPRPVDGPGGPAAAAVVERFLQLAHDRQYVQMGWVFGNAQGAVIQSWPQAEVEQRMYALARLLEHDSFLVGPGAAVPGRIGAAERFQVQLRAGNRQFQVPFTAVRGPGQRWYVEQVAVEAITNVP
jgi:hypothetical protein